MNTTIIIVIVAILAMAIGWAVAMYLSRKNAKSQANEIIEKARLEAEATDPAIKTSALTELRSMAVRLEGQKAQWYQKSIPFIRAEQLLKKINAEK